MNKKLVCSVLFLLVVAACGAKQATTEEVTSPEATTEAVDSPDGEFVSDEQFCIPAIPREREGIDFSVLNDVKAILKLNSVFVETAKDPELLFRGAFENIFGFLAVPSDQIPEWATKIVDDELVRHPQNPDFSVLNQVYQGLLNNPEYSDLQDPSRREGLIEASVRGVIKAVGDPFATYMSAESWKSGRADNSGRYHGIGIQVEPSDGGVSIASVFDGFPAEIAGLKAGDEVVRVNGLSTENCNPGQFVLSIRALENPTLDLTIKRESSTSTEREVIEIAVTMGEIKRVLLGTYPGIELPDGRGNTQENIPYRCDGDSVAANLPCPFVDADRDGVPDILYIFIEQFEAQTGTDLEYFLSNTDLTSFKGVVIDVRDNPGGLIQTAIDVVDFFLPTDGPIFINRHANGERTNAWSNKVTYLPTDTPLVILMNRESYSSSELIAAALRDHGRAVIVNRDDRSGGKGSINTYFTLRLGEYGAVYVSISLWLTPNGEVIESQDLDNDGYYEIGGLRPDIHVPWSDDDFSKNGRDVNYDPTLQAALKYIEEHPVADGE